RLDIPQAADLEYVRIIPAFLQCRVREDEREWRVQREKLLLVAHDEMIRSLGILTAGLAAFIGVGPAAFPVDREVPVVDELRRRTRGRISEQCRVIRLP